MTSLDTAALVVSCVISLVWFDELWAIGEAGGFWLGTIIRKLLFRGDQ